MYCSNCGNLIQDGAAFCPICGAQQPTPSASPYGGGQNAQNYAPIPVPAPVEVPGDFQSAAAAKPKSRNLLPIFIGAVLLLILAIVGAVFLFTNMAGNAGGEGYVYYADGAYYKITDLKKGESIKFAEASNGAGNTEDYRLLFFSTDKKYVYFYTNCDFTLGAGTLCCAEYAKLHENMTENEYTVISRIAILGALPCSENDILFKAADSSLQYYDSKENRAEKIADYVIDYDLAQDGSIVFFTLRGQLYVADIHDPTNAKILDYDVESCLFAEDKEHILYCKSAASDKPIKYSLTLDENWYDIYEGGLNSKSKLLFENAEVLSPMYSFSLINTYDTPYFFVASDDKINLYDYITDDYAAADAAAQKEADEKGRAVSYEVQQRNKLRTELKDPSNFCSAFDLYYYQDGKANLLLDSVLDYISSGNVYLFNTLDTAIVATISSQKEYFSDIYSADSVWFRFSQIDPSAQNYIVSCDDNPKVRRMSENAAGAYADACSDEDITFNINRGLHAVGDAVYMESPDGDLYRAEVKDDTVGEFVLFAENSKFIDAIDDKVYCAENTSGSERNLVGDLCEYDGKNREVILQNAPLGGKFIYFFDNGSIFTLDIFGGGSFDSLLTYNSGNETFSAPDTSSFISINASMFLYISENTLYLYDNGKVTQIAENVERVLSAEGQGDFKSIISR